MSSRIKCTNLHDVTRQVEGIPPIVKIVNGTGRTVIPKYISEASNKTPDTIYSFY